MQILKGLAILIVALFVLQSTGLIEGWATSPGTLIQLASSSGYYPFWRYGYGYRYPYYRFMYPYNGYSRYYRHRRWPKPYGHYMYW